MGKDIKTKVANCWYCLGKSPHRPVSRDYPRSKKHHYLVQVSYCSRYTDVAHLPNITASTVIGKMKGWFAHSVIPESVMSDNGTQPSSSEFRSFADNLILILIYLFYTLYYILREFGSPYLGKATAAATAAPPSATCAYWVCPCYHNPPKSDMDYRICN